MVGCGVAATGREPEARRQGSDKELDDEMGEGDVLLKANIMTGAREPVAVHWRAKTGALADVEEV
jgi:hypothetical protein